MPITTTITVHDAIVAYLRHHSDVVTAVAAKELIDTILPEDAVRQWLWDRRYEVMAGHIAAVSRATGSREARDRRHGEFEDIAGQLEDVIANEASGGQPVQEFYKMWHCANRDGQAVRKRLGDMTREEVLFHQNRQQNSIRYYQRRVKFLKHITSQLREGQVVGELFTADELDRLLESIT